jgi:hypothetical protein
MKSQPDRYADIQQSLMVNPFRVPKKEKKKKKKK